MVKSIFCPMFTKSPIPALLLSCLLALVSLSCSPPEARLMRTSALASESYGLLSSSHPLWSIQASSTPGLEEEGVFLNVLERYTYDQEGRLTFRETWDLYGELPEDLETPDKEYTYTWDGFRLLRISSGRSIWDFHWEGYHLASSQREAGQDLSQTIYYYGQQDQMIGRWTRSRILGAPLLSIKETIIPSADDMLMVSIQDEETPERTGQIQMDFDQEGRLQVITSQIFGSLIRRTLYSYQPMDEENLPQIRENTTSDLPPQEIILDPEVVWEAMDENEDDQASLPSGE